MRKILRYECDFSFPTNSEIEKCIEIANKKDRIVELTWKNDKYYKTFTIRRGMSLGDCLALIELNK